VKTSVFDHFLTKICPKQRKKDKKQAKLTNWHKGNVQLKGKKDKVNKNKRQFD
jgi:hypothetical protein